MPAIVSSDTQTLTVMIAERRLTSSLDANGVHQPRMGHLTSGRPGRVSHLQRPYEALTPRVRKEIQVTQ